MARPRSGDKQLALLRAATEVIASSGLGASTASIAKLAGVAEGTLFRYFATKDVLLAAVFEHLIEEMESCLTFGYEASAPVKMRTQVLWNNYIDWGIAHPTAYATMNQLVVSSKLTPEQMDRAMKVCADAGVRPETPLFEGLTCGEAVEFRDAVLTSIANTTIGLANARPSLTGAYKAAGFDVMWHAITLVQA